MLRSAWVELMSMRGGNMGVLLPAAVLNGFAPKFAAAAAYRACCASTEDEAGFFRWFMSMTHSFEDTEVPLIELPDDAEVLLLPGVVLLFF
jgi:hypothetical protein